MPARNKEIAEKLRKKRINEKIAKKRLKGGIESRADIKARVKGTPKPKPKIPSRSKEEMKYKRSKIKKIKVRKGDNLTHIADRNGTTVDVLKMMNPGIKPKEMPIGMILNVPALKSTWNK